MSKRTNINGEKFKLSLCAIFFTFLNISFGNSKFKVTVSNSLNIGNNIQLSNISSHFLNHLNLKEIHVIKAILISIDFVNHHVFGFIKNNWSAFVVLAQIIKHVHFMKVIEVFPFILCCDIFVPL